ncbi:hypothetical protein GCM10011519_27280 [Marmoricola endophyticus]|uniref:Glycosyltransferase n=1 Tax=Marmoricola endophyticus TaxID=2040280 RepID=A0A917BNM4_9ACTN|nr:glycosyltransferase [Marmoricola endophyticus]GGF51799.1 hypothetical protein GCM10011519_27280 [Marmoricola endophyticus]
MELTVLAGPVPRRPDGRVLVAAKTTTGMAAYAEHWPGTVRMVGRPVPSDPSANLDVDWVDPGQLPFALDLADDPVADTLARPGRGVVLAGLDPAHEPLLGGHRPVVLLAENTPANQAAYTLLDGGTTALTRARVRLGAVRRDLRQRAMVRRAAGLQCNGWPTWDRYARGSAAPMLYLDSRIRREQLAAPTAPVADGPLRVAFSGRWLRTKGINTVVAVARECERRRLPVTVELLGSGPEEERVRRDAPDGLRLTGALPFDPDWVRHVSRSVDVMLLPHPQADPSGTYLEALACGAPVLACDNAYARRLIGESRAGWSAPVGDVGALTDRLAALARDRAEIVRARAAGVAFMAEHLFADEFRRRVEHVLALT